MSVYNEVVGSMKEIKSKLVIFLGIPLLFLLVVDSFPIEKTIVGVCSRVLDGDTIIVNKVRVRLASIDAPESSQFSYDGIAIGKMSKSYLERLILGKVVEVRFFKKGYYGRVIGTVYLKEDINLKMIEAGMALAYLVGGRVKYSSGEYEARLLRKGIFGTHGFDRPSAFRKAEKRPAFVSRPYVH